ncbi:hypothetical protein MN116_003505 [Schistosoma mekongi]|uniref:MRG domain-containing protein n=1 Tax=Schistosoma mekongi TaxID=38744 RepID=A0AAE1ZID4_SCHME|nr:hypothetical protein MN116_003505 [Schistosoma mekongi]
MHSRPHRYDIGQKLLCFEPDSSKAKLIYFAKILKHVSRRDTDIPHYSVHFHGWKCKWDREVPEDLLLENNEFNRILKRKIDEVAQNVRARYQRKQRIDMILEGAALSGDDVNWDTIPGVWKASKSRRSYDSLASSNNNSEKTFINSTSFGDNTSVLDSVLTSILDQEETTQLQFEQLQIHKPYLVSLDLPQNLRNILKCHTDASDVGLDVSKTFHYWCSVLQVLQKYVDGFPYSGLSINSLLGYCSSSNGIISDRVSRVMNPLFSQTDRNRLICAEVCSSLRILFDFTLRHYLLLPNERLYFLNDFNGQLFEDGRAFCVNFPHEPSNIHSVYRFSSPRYELLPNSEVVKNPQLPCLNYPPYYLLRLLTILPTLLDGMQLTLCRRAIIHRHLYMFIHYLDRTSEFWFRKCSSLHKDIHSVPTKLEQSSINTTVSESSSDTEPLTIVCHDKSLRRTTRNTPKYQSLTIKSDLSSELSSSAMKSLHDSDISPTVALNSQSVNVHLNEMITKDSNIHVPLTSSSITTTAPTISGSVLTLIKSKQNLGNYPSTNVTSQSPVAAKQATRSIRSLTENKQSGKSQSYHHHTKTTTCTTTAAVSTLLDNPDQSIRLTRSTVMRLNKMNSGPILRSHSLRGK